MTHHLDSTSSLYLLNLHWLLHVHKWVGNDKLLYYWCHILHNQIGLSLFLCWLRIKKLPHSVNEYACPHAVPDMLIHAHMERWRHVAWHQRPWIAINEPCCHFQGWYPWCAHECRMAPDACAHSPQNSINITYFGHVVCASNLDRSSSQINLLSAGEAIIAQIPPVCSHHCNYGGSWPDGLTLYLGFFWMPRHLWSESRGVLLEGWLYCGVVGHFIFYFCDECCPLSGTKSYFLHQMRVQSHL